MQTSACFNIQDAPAAKLDHPGIVPVHEVGMHAGQHFYSMDYVAGGSLSKLHRDEPVAARRAAELVRQMAEAIHYAHGKGIVHRDLKPANVLLTTTGVPRITDFGLAKRMWADEDSTSVHITETGQVLGTAGYMSPEQAEGQTKLVGEPADIYSLGAVRYALLTNRAPFVGESQADTIKQVIEKDEKRIAFSPAYKNIAASSSHSIHVHRADPLADGEAEFRLPLLDQQGTVKVKDFAFLLDANLLVVFENNGVTFCDLSETVARKENLPFTTIAEDSLGEGWLSENSRYLIFNRVSRTTAAAKRSGDVTHEVWDLVERKCIGKASSLLSIIRDMSKDRSGI